LLFDREGHLNICTSYKTFLKILPDKELRRGNFVAHAHEGALIVTGTGATGFAGKDALGEWLEIDIMKTYGRPIAPHVPNCRKDLGKKGREVLC
jgi:hypothetical protein